MQLIKTAIIALAAGLLLSACNHLSSRAKEMVGNYYIPEISEEMPVMELNKNGKCVIRAIKPDVLTFTVEGKWNVEGDSLVADLDPETIKCEGDTTFMGSVPTHLSKYITEFSGVTLTVNDHGVNYVYHRRPN